MENQVLQPEKEITKVSLTKKQREIIDEINKEKNALQEKFSVIQKRENDIVSFILEYEEISPSQVESISYEDGVISITKLPVLS